MNSEQMRLVGAAVFYAVIFFSGFSLSRFGKPYNGIVYNVHKLIALAGVVLFFVALHQTNRAVALGAREWIAGVCAGVFFLALFVTGALVSIERPMPAFVFNLHHAAPYLAVLATAVTLLLLLRRAA